MRRTVHLAAWIVVLVLAALSGGCNSTWVSSGLLYQEQDNWAKAEEMFRKALWYDETEAAAHYQLAYTLAYRAENEHLAKGEIDSARIKIEEAFEHYQLAKEYDPEKYDYNPDAENEEDRTPAENGIASMYAHLFNKGVQYMQADDIDNALLYFDLARLADPRGARGFEAALLSAKLRYNRVVNSDERNEAELEKILAEMEALKVGDDWEDAGEKKADLAQTKAQVLRSLGRESEAAALYEQLLAESPDDIDLLQAVARIRLNQQDYTGGATLLERTLDLIESDSEFSDEDRFAVAYQALAAYRSAEDYDKVIALADRAWKFATSTRQRSQLARAKARAYYEKGQFDQAVATVEPVVVDGGIDPNNVEAWQIYYLSLNKVGRVSEAERARERFITLRDAGGR